MAVTPLEQALGDGTRESELTRVLARMREYGVTHVYLQYTSVPGRVMGKIVPAGHFERIACSGLAWTYLSAGGFASDIAGQLIGPTGAVAAEGLLIPDLATFQILPWDTDVARVFCDHFHRDDDARRPGEIALGDSRANLKRLVAALEAAHGLTLKTGCEPEMSWFPSSDQITAGISKLPGHVSTAYHIGHIEEIRPILKQVTRYGQALGLDMIQADYEDPGQIEMNFMFGTAVETADRLVTYRQICMQVAKEFGVLATFMPKPVAGIMANGCHHHLSLWAGEDSVLTDDGRQYARYWDAGLFAPTVPVWGYDNRLAIVRVLGSRLEYRAPDASCNPYLTHAVLIAALRDGIENRIEPGPPLGDGDHRPDPGDARFALLPSTLAEALDALDGDEVVRGALPVDILETFVATKRDEWARSCGAVTDWARDMYLTYLP